MAAVRKIVVKLDVVILEKQPGTSVDDTSWEEISSFWLGGSSEDFQLDSTIETSQWSDGDGWLTHQIVPGSGVLTLDISSILFSSGAIGEIRITARGPSPVNGE